MPESHQAPRVTYAEGDSRGLVVVARYAQASVPSPEEPTRSG